MSSYKKFFFAFVHSQFFRNATDGEFWLWVALSSLQCQLEVHCTKVLGAGEWLTAELTSSKDWRYVRTFARGYVNIRAFQSGQCEWIGPISKPLPATNGRPKSIQFSPHNGRLFRKIYLGLMRSTGINKSLSFAHWSKVSEVTWFLSFRHLRAETRRSRVHKKIAT